MPITVSNTTQLYSALSSCKGGETILLTGGQYGSLNINPYMKPPVNMDFPSTVTITSADPANPAVFSSASVREISNLTVDGVTFDYTFKPGDNQGTTPFTFAGCDGLTIRNSTFDGDEAYGAASYANGYGSGIGLRVQDSTNAVIEGNESYNFHRGMAFNGNENLIVRDNELHSMRMDGMAFVKSKGVLIEDNYIHDFRGSPTSGDHCDMIQFWTTGTTVPSSDIVIRGNVLDIGNGTFTQTLFMNNEVVNANSASFDTMAYRNVTIEDNTIINAHQWGIYVGAAKGVVIDQNTVVHADGGKVDGWDHPVEIPLIEVSSKSTSVTVTDNVTSQVNGYTGQAGWTVKDNTFVQDQNSTKPGYYGDVFVQSSLQPEADGSHHYVAVTGGTIDLLNRGSEATQPQSPPVEIEDTVSVRVSGDAWKGDPAFKLTLNGATVAASTTVTADHANGEWQTVTFKGDFNLDGSDRVGVSFTNDAWGGSSSTDRNLYVDEVSLNDEVNTTNWNFMRNGTQYWDFLKTPVEIEDTVSVRVSGDAWKGDPAFKLTLNGATVAASTTVTADHANGEWQTVTFKGDFNLDGSDRVGVSFTNDAWGGSSSTDRNLYVDEVSLNDEVNTTNWKFGPNGTQYWDF